jgi:hypothetical protein
MSVTEYSGERDETWLPVTGYEGMYEVSNHARVRSLDRNGRKGRILKQTIFNTGYYHVSLSIGNVRPNKRVHRLMMLAFAPNPENLPHINHIDGNKLNNAMDNLEWCTPKHNTRHAFATRLNKAGAWLSDEQLKYVLSMRGKMTAPALAKNLPISDQSIYNIWNNKSYMHARRAL